ncbi:NADPH:quinone oxidoreductase family protein [Nocardia sp. CA2R105]|uniref:NADPH:quinone oxidoreductase family protein n=1 Tax=Nocardia coffeae TaxID=2873381 RepID=UPI001CA61A44|nr:NADPH:quinone oxidoreductase family protein [Nocardia coffeae]MBY8863761.1 NADPH:quinone oxidoreductase family protein [Nocardia coffeae]
MTVRDTSYESRRYRAWQTNSFGIPAEVMNFTHLPRPIPAAGQVSIAVECAGVNLPDLLLINGTHQLRPEPPFTPGREVVGRILETSSTGEWRCGTRVVARPLLPYGGYAEVTVARTKDLFPVPEDLEPTVAATLLVACLTSHVALHHRAGLQRGETVVVLGGAGGVGSAAIQLAKAAGATVIATAAGRARMAACQRLGADIVVDRHNDNLTAAIRDETRGRGADVIIDAVGGEVFDSARKALAFEGRAVLVGTSSGSAATLSGTAVLLRNQSIFGLHLGPYQDHAPAITRAAFEQLITLVEAGKLQPLIADVLPLSDALAGLERLQSGDVIGKLVLRI